MIKMDNTEIITIRDEIDRLDETIIKLLAKRDENAKRIALIKKKGSLAIANKEREEELFDRIRTKAKENMIDGQFITELFKRIVEHSKKVQKIEEDKND